MRADRDLLPPGLQIPSPFHFAAFCRNVATFRGRELRLIPTPLGDGLSGLWIPYPEYDAVHFEPTTLRLHDQHIVLHEIAHMVLDHLHDPDRARALRDRLGLLVEPALIERLLARTSYGDEQEVQAEALVTLILGRSRRPPPRSPARGPATRERGGPTVALGPVVRPFRRRVGTWRRWVRRGVLVVRLRPLWRDLVRLCPDVVLPDQTLLRTPDDALYRIVIEINDAALTLRTRSAVGAAPTDAARVLCGRVEDALRRCAAAAGGGADEGTGTDHSPHGMDVAIDAVAAALAARTRVPRRAGSGPE